MYFRVDGENDSFSIGISPHMDGNFECVVAYVGLEIAGVLGKTRWDLRCRHQHQNSVLDEAAFRAIFGSSWANVQDTLMNAPDSPIIVEPSTVPLRLRESRGVLANELRRFLSLAPIRTIQNPNNKVLFRRVSYLTQFGIVMRECLT